LVSAIVEPPTPSFTEDPIRELLAETTPVIPVVPLPHVTAPVDSVAPLFQNGLLTMKFPLDKGVIVMPTLSFIDEPVKVLMRVWSDPL
jgi:hypothetical protein